MAELCIIIDSASAAERQIGPELALASPFSLAARTQHTREGLSFGAAYSGSAWKFTWCHFLT